MNLLKNYYSFTKAGIVGFALLTAGAGYLLSLADISFFSFEKLMLFFVGFYFVCSGSFILNQAQESSLDIKMNRTKKRPIPSEKVSLFQAYLLSFLFLLFGLGVLFLLKPLTSALAILALVLYNGFYTLWWKKHFKYGAVLGAFPGALPPVIGYSLGDGFIFSRTSIYLFFLLFFWQMPHFWSLAIRYKEDYKKAGLPILSVVEAYDKALYHIGLYMLAYLGLALISPLFLKAGLMYVFFLIPFVIILFYQFQKYLHNSKHWLSFFLWINVSILVYFAVPVLDKLIFYYMIQWSNNSFLVGL